MKPLLTASEVADLLKVNLETVYSLIRKEHLPAAKVGGQWRFRESDINCWIEACCCSSQSADSIKTADSVVRREA